MMVFGALDMKRIHVYKNPSSIEVIALVKNKFEIKQKLMREIMIHHREHEALRKIV
jgi:hypothetical protein